MGKIEEKFRRLTYSCLGWVIHSENSERKSSERKSYTQEEDSKNLKHTIKEETVSIETKMGLHGFEI